MKIKKNSKQIVSGLIVCSTLNNCYEKLLDKDVQKEQESMFLAELFKKELRT